MPYSKTADLPQAVRDALPPRAQRVFMSAFNGARDSGLSEERSFANAWGAVRNGGWKRSAEGGKWVKKAGPDRSDVHVDAPLGNRGKPKKKPDDEDDAEKSAAFKFEVTKLVEDELLVYGWLSVIEDNGTPVVDLQGHVIDEATMEKAAHDFLLERGVAAEMHERIGIGEGVVASIPFTKALQEALGIDLKKVGWFIGLKVDADAFTKVKDGTYRAFSLGGTGTLEDMLEAA